MRSEAMMMDMILSFARNHEQIRVVAMNGSRTNAKIPRDRFQDYDIVYLVTDMKPFIADKQWLDIFGKRIILQTPEAMSLFPPSSDGWFSYLMLFEDGNRIDLTLIPLKDLERYLQQDALTVIVMDKDGRAGAISEPTDADHWVKKPSPAYFNDCCNEFWWVSTYIVKGLCRKEFLYAAEHLNLCVRPELLRMLSWKIGIETNFSLSVGKSYKYLEQYVAEETWKRLLKTYRNDTSEHIRDALFECQSLFRETSQFVAEQYGFEYPDYDAAVSTYTWNFLGNEAVSP